jgi:hypothetical protein
MHVPTPSVEARGIEARTVYATRARPGVNFVWTGFSNIRNFEQTNWGMPSIDRASIVVFCCYRMATMRVFSLAKTDLLRQPAPDERPTKKAVE